MPEAINNMLLLSFIDATFIYWSENKETGAQVQHNFSSGGCFPKQLLPKKVQETKGVNHLVISGTLDADGRYTPLAVEQFNGYAPDEGLFSHVEHVPLGKEAVEWAR